LETQEELVIDNEYIMSPKDLCTIDIMNEVIDSGARVLKIEGRGKSADYVYVTTKCYREAMDAVKSGTYDAHKVALWKKELETVYNRGFWEGYYLGRKLGEWTPDPGNIATLKKVYIGKGSKYFPKIQIAEFTVESGKIRLGDEIMIIGAKVGVLKQKMHELYVNGEKAEEANKGDKITLPLEHKLSLSDKLYKIVES
jgi:putative protease